MGIQLTKTDVKLSSKYVILEARHMFSLPPEARPGSLWGQMPGDASRVGGIAISMAKGILPRQTQAHESWSLWISGNLLMTLFFFFCK